MKKQVKKKPAPPITAEDVCGTIRRLLTQTMEVRIAFVTLAEVQQYGVNRLAAEAVMKRIDELHGHLNRCEDLLMKHHGVKPRDPHNDTLYLGKSDFSFTQETKDEAF